MVPVAVNACSLAADYAYMLEHCRAQADHVKPVGALVAVVQQALSRRSMRSIHICHKPEASQGLLPALSQGPIGAANAARLCRQKPWAAARLWLYSSAPPANPGDGCIPTPTPTGRAETVWQTGAGPERKTMSAFPPPSFPSAYGLAAMTFLEAWSQRGADGRAPPLENFQALDRAPAHSVSERLLRALPGMLASPCPAAGTPNRSRRACARRAGEALAAGIAQRFKTHFGADIVGRHRLHRNAAYLPLNRRTVIAAAAPAKPVPG